MAGQKSPWLTGVGLLMLAVVSGCGSGLRPVVSPIAPTGPSPQPTTLVAVVSQQNAPGTILGPTQASAVAGVATILDFAGDSVLAQAYVGPSPIGFAVSVNGGAGYTLNQDATISTFPISSQLQTKVVTVTTLLAGTQPVNVLSSSGSVYLADTANSQIDYLTGSPISLKQAIPVGTGPITVIGTGTGQRVYAITQGVAPGACDVPFPTTAGAAYAIETATNTVSNTIPLGICPVYGVESADNLRVFILNRGSGTITVINGQSNEFLQTITIGLGPVYAEIYRIANMLVTANYDSDSISFIDINTDIYGNNGPNFGKVLGTVQLPAGSHPSSVTVLQDGSRAYTANQGTGSVSVIDMASFTVKKTIAVPADPGTGVTATPRSVASITNSLLSKVYVTSPNSSQATIIRTDTDSISATVQLPGNVIELHAAAQQAGASGTASNAINVSHSLGSGAP